jgi:hypothetical protein
LALQFRVETVQVLGEAAVGLRLLWPCAHFSAEPRVQC